MLSLDTSLIWNIIYQNYDVGIVLEDDNGKILNANPSFQQLIGYSEKELQSMKTADITHPEDIREDLKLYNEIIEGKRENCKMNKRFITKSGKILNGRTNRYAIKAPKGGANKYILTLIHDLTEHFQLSEELTLNQSLFNALLENSTDSIYFKDLESRFIKVNKEVAKTHNVENPALLIGKTDFDLFNREHATETFNDEQQIIRTGNPIINKEEKIELPGSKIIWVSTSKMPCYDNTGKIIGTIGITHDITKAKQTEESLQSERIFLRTVMDNLPDAIFAKDLNYRKTFVNKADLQNMDCKNEKDAIGKTDYSFFPKEIADHFHNDDQLVVKTGSAILNREEFFYDKSGNERWLLTSKLPLKNEKDEITGIIGIGHDITERRKSQKIREVLYQISETANTTSDMFSFYRQIHKIIQSLISANNFYIVLYNEKTDMISFPYFIDERIESMPDKKLGNGLNSYVIRNGIPLLVDYDQINELKKSGNVKITYTPAAVWLGVPLKLEGKCIGAIVVRNYENTKAYSQEDLHLLLFVSEQVAQVIARRRTSEEIKKYAEELKQLNQTKDKFFSIIAHDLKNPFITILGFSDLLFSDYSELTDEERLYYIGEMKKSADSSHSLLLNLQQWSRSQTNRIEFSPMELQIDNVILENIELMMATAERKKIKIIYEIIQPKTVYADKDMLNTIIRNIISNSIKFTEQGGTITLETFDAGEFVEVSVKDTGIGINKDNLNKLFRLDASYSSPGTDKESGTGLGLILCKEFVERNGGSISVKSELGKGSIFVFSLPKPAVKPE